MIRHSFLTAALIAVLSLAVPTQSQAFFGFFGFNFGFGGWGGPGWWGPGYWGGPSYWGEPGYWGYDYYGYHPYRYYGWGNPFLSYPYYSLTLPYAYPPLLAQAAPTAKEK